jgi:hypothetical protein
MNVWQCEVFANRDLTLPCVTFIGKFETARLAMQTLVHQLEAVQISLYPGVMREVADDGSWVTGAVRFRMIRFAATPGAATP